MLRTFNKICENNRIQLLTKRFIGQHNKKHIYKDGKRYGALMYYPKDPNHEDPPMEAVKLFRVQRVKPVKGTPYWERRIMQDLGILDKKSQFAIVKNIPENNQMLWKIKHLIEIQPITFPYGEPTENDINHTFLKEDGTCLVTKEITVNEERIKAGENFLKDPARLNIDTLEKDSRLKWLNPW